MILTELNYRFIQQGYGLSPFGNTNSDRHSRGEVETFFSRTGHVTETHTDFQENFTIQLSGRKKWTFKKSSLNGPIRGCTPHFGSDQGNEVIETQMKCALVCDNIFDPSSSTSLVSSSKVKDKKHKKKKVDETDNHQQHANEDNYTIIMEEGDVLYHPAGIWHRVECMENSVAINISLFASSAAEVVCSALQQYLWQKNPLFRRPLFTRTDDEIESFSGKSAKQVVKEILELELPSIANFLKAEDIIPLPCIQKRIESDAIRNVEASRGESANIDEGDEEEEEEEEEEEGEEEEEEEVAEEEDICIMGHDNSFIDNQPAGSKKWRINPLAVICDSKSLEIFGWDIAKKCQRHHKMKKYDNLFVIHSGFGNEHMESACRKLISVSFEYEQIFKHFRSYFYESKDRSNPQWFEATTETFLGTYINKIEKDSNRKRKNQEHEDYVQLVHNMFYSLELVGVVHKL